MSNTPLLAASVSLVVALITSLTTFFVQERRLRRESDLQLRLQEEKLRNELNLQDQRSSHELRLQEDRFRTELRTEFMAEEAMKKLLKHPRWDKQRTFDRIKERVGGFDDEELRRLLIRAGAVKFKRKSDGAEMWGLRERNEDEL